MIILVFIQTNHVQQEKDIRECSISQIQTRLPNLLEGIIAIRRMHIRAIKETGLTSADEMLYPENRSYLDDILSYEAIGARSVENQQHRLTASGMDIPVGMKNPTSGDFQL